MKACSSVSTEGEGELRIDEKGAQRARHLGVGHRLVRAQREQRIEPHRRKAGRLDRGHVPAGALDVERRRLRRRRDRAPSPLTEVLPPPCSTSFGSRADQPRGIDAQRKLGRNAGLAIDDRPRLWRRARPRRISFCRPHDRDHALVLVAGAALRPPAALGRAAVFRRGAGDHRLRRRQSRRGRGAPRRRTMRARARSSAGAAGSRPADCAGGGSAGGA